MEFLKQYKGPFYHLLGYGYGYGIGGSGNPYINDTLHQGVDWLDEDFSEVKRYQHNLIFTYNEQR